MYSKSARYNNYYYFSTSAIERDSVNYWRSNYSELLKVVSELDLIFSKDYENMYSIEFLHRPVYRSIFYHNFIMYQKMNYNTVIRTNNYNMEWNFKNNYNIEWNSTNKYNMEWYSTNKYIILCKKKGLK